MKFFITTAIALIVILFSAAELYAQQFPPPDPQAVPLDPLSWVLLAAGGGVAARKYYKSKLGDN